ncbi:MAG: hypothetical protein WC756_22160 [Taibaiella sp.]|jgi:hypothetical protein
MSNYPSGYVEQESLDNYLERLNNTLDNANGLLLWVLYNHQGGNSDIGQPIRKFFNIGQFDELTEEQVKQAKNYVKNI